MAPRSKHSGGKKTPARNLQVQRQPRAAESMTYQRRPMNPPSGHVHHHRVTVQHPPSVQHRTNPPSKRQMMQIRRIQQTQQGLQKQIAAYRRQHEEERQAFARQQASWIQERDSFRRKQQHKFKQAQEHFEQERSRNQWERDQWLLNTQTMLNNEREQWERQQSEKEASKTAEWELREREQRERYENLDKEHHKTFAMLASGAAVGVGIGAGLAFANAPSDSGDESSAESNNEGSNDSDDDRSMEDSNAVFEDVEHDPNDASVIEMHQYPFAEPIDEEEKTEKMEKRAAGGVAESVFDLPF
ncbi:hypothetical protein AA0119_g12863 [Alternaria tenuissima]|uniref:Uncharacterized protein n=1 Tax=Alternaria tenuissima TaxID=119927 RepID=A0ABY0FQ24_9PLEO|nr:hypothetical protein AA0119_g12863 [Alternaria tenuissima]